MMRKVLIIILLTIQTIGLSAQVDSCSLSPNELWLASLQHRLDSITRNVEKQKYSAGYSIYDLTADSTLFCYRAQSMMKPASTQKLFVSIAALSSVGGDYLFNTYLNIDGTTRTDSNGRRYLKGDICLRGCFDPTLQVEDFEQLANSISKLDIDSIDGMIVVDNQVKLDVKKVKDVQLHLASSLYTILQNKGYVFSSPKPYATSLVPVTRGWNIGRISTPITKVLNRMLKRSDNTYAECMLLNLYGMDIHGGWNYEKCKQQVTSMIADANGNLNDYTIIDGSGLSHDNRSTPELLTTILRYAYHNKDIYPVLFDNLPIAGIDGTLSDRMKTGAAFNNVRAKTGTLNGVSTLSGYVTAQNGHQLAFAIMVNNVAAATGKALQNSICQELAK